MVKIKSQSAKVLHKKTATPDHLGRLLPAAPDELLAEVPPAPSRSFEGVGEVARVRWAADVKVNRHG